MEYGFETIRVFSLGLLIPSWFILVLYHKLGYNHIMKKKSITFLVPELESDRLTKYCLLTGRTQSDVLREFIRTLKPESVV